jgi:hypothetical protein
MNTKVLDVTCIEQIYSYGLHVAGFGQIIFPYLFCMRNTSQQSLTTIPPNSLTFKLYESLTSFFCFSETKFNFISTSNTNKLASGIYFCFDCKLSFFSSQYLCSSFRYLGT